ncbi:hypothetical protein GCM10010912_66100 [Paenibacillus albidus]|uniref:Polymer-forming cytoskeletal protein n=1 Tax=Paenibacillus albidus TaxID=2041023 RepID=A0A917D7U7_9BACL|nr:hypothetical protein [Paenibacillus albidus]GGG12434.1 hypothetical protein GCM10010912_66100 [Paenibacillus albidus]
MSNFFSASEHSGQLPLKVKGSLIRREDIEASAVEVFGHLKARGNVTAERVKISGECSIGGICRADQVENLGSLRVDSLQAERVTSSGYLAVTQETRCGSFRAEGAVQLHTLKASQAIELRLGSACSIDHMSSDGLVTVVSSSMLLNLVMRPFRKLCCKSIKGTSIILERTRAELVSGEKIVIGPGCVIEEIRYGTSLAVDPKSKVTSAIHVSTTGGK